MPKEATGRVHQFEAPRETFTEAPAQSARRSAFDFDAEAGKHPSTEDKADALIEEIGQKIEASIGGTAPADGGRKDEPTRKLDELHGVFSPQKQKIFDELQFGNKKK